MGLPTLKPAFFSNQAMHLQENTFFDLGVKFTQIAAQYPLYYVTYAPAKFEVVMSKGL